MSPMGDVKKDTVSTLTDLFGTWLAAHATPEQLDSYNAFYAREIEPALRQPDTRMEGGGEPAEWQLEAAWARAEKMSSDTRIQNMSALREILKAVEEARSKLAANEYPEDIERDAPSSPTVGELEDVADALTEFSDIDEAEGGNPHVIATERRAAVLLRAAADALSSAQSSIQRAERERDDLRLVISECADALGNGASISADASLDFTKLLPTEIRSVLLNLRARQYALKAQLKEARKVLEPFAKVAGEYSDQEDDSHEVWKDAGPEKIIQGSFELRNFRAARSLYASLGEKQDAE